MDTRVTEQRPARVARAAATLAIAVACAVGLVTLLHQVTRPLAEHNERERRLARFKELIPPGGYDNEPLEDVVHVRSPDLLGTDSPLPVYRLRRHGKAVAALITAVAPNGYSGSIRLVVAIDAGGRLLGVRVLEHRETPGIGDAIDERKSDWIRSFTGRSLMDPPPERWGVRKDGGDFDQFTGATVTPRAVVRAVYNAQVFYQQNREHVLSAPAD
jgi:electron transport complex protein RnfG